MSARAWWLGAVVAAAAAPGAGAQSLAQRVASADGITQVVYPSRPDACGDGASYIGNVFGRSTWYDGGSSGRGQRYDRPCIHGPARVVATVVNGEVTRLRVYVGPERPATMHEHTITATARDASAWLGDLILSAPARVASDAIFPLALADVPDPWTPLLAVARNTDRPLTVRRAALTWLAIGVTDHLGLTDEVPVSDDDEMRKQAVFVLSQRPKGESVPELIELARSASRPIARREAIFWLGQTGDLRAADVYAELLKR